MSRLSAFEAAREMGHEEVVLVQDPSAGLLGIIAIHDTTLGPAVGGTRMRLYPSLDAAALDALRLARAMTYKAAMAGVARGGGKAVIVGDPSRDKSRALLAAYAKALDRLGGRFQTGCDMGIDGRDVAVLSRLTRHVTHTAPDSKLQTGGLAALGVFASIRAVARRMGRELAGLHVAVQGLGQLGYRLAEMLASAGARLTVADLDPGRAERAAGALGAAVAPPDAILGVEADVFSPNAAGGVIDDDAVSRLRCRAVVGGANEQLAEPRHGDALFERGILFAPDYVANAGGLLSLLYEIGELDEDGVVARVEAIGDRVGEILDRAEAEGLAPHRLADRMAQERLAAARGKEEAMKTLKLAGGPLAYDVRGEGPAVLFLHAFPLGLVMWDAEARALEATHQVVRFDCRGFGASPPGDGLLTMERIADDAAALLDRLAIGRVVVCGLSMGGYAAFAMVRRHADRLKGLVLADTRAGADSEEGRRNRALLAEKVRQEGAAAAADAFVPKLLGETTHRERPEVVARVRGIILETSPRGIVDALAGLAARADSTPTLREIRVPTLVVCGGEDTLTPVAESRAMSDAIAGSRLEVLPRAGHLANLEDPSAFQHALKTFLSGLA